MQRTEITELSPTLDTQIHIREVRVNYHSTSVKKFAITGPEDAAGFVRSILPDNSREHFVALFLDGANHVASYSLISTGTANQCLAHPREVFQRALIAGATAIVVAHNHPSGVLTPSSEDMNVTRTLRAGADLLGIKFLDHLIITDSDFVSLEGI